MKTLGLYIHVPFCERKCNYCDFFSISTQSAEYISQYVDTVVNSLRIWSEKLKEYTIDTIYFGGGTPSLLSTDDIAKILKTVRAHFHTETNPEITIEVNPNSVNKLELEVLSTIGLNRISMGLQSTNDKELQLLGRLHNREDAKTAIERIKQAGIDNFSLDVMLGIPLQTISSLTDTLNFCISVGAKHISTYMLKIEENTPFFFNKDNLAFADSDTMADLYEYTCGYLKDNGFRHYEISNFCKDGLISNHNMKYWTLDDYLGIGPSAHSLINRERFYYPRDFESFAANKTIRESEGNSAEEYIMLSLRTDNGLDLNTLRENFEVSINTSFLNKCKNYHSAGFLNFREDKLTLTAKGFLVSNTIISELIGALI